MIDVIREIPVSTLVGILVLLPFVAGVVAWIFFNDRTWRRDAVRAVGLVLSLAALLLAFDGNLVRRALVFDPSPVFGLSWDAIIAALDLALLGAFVVIGALRRSPLVIALGVAQVAPMAWVELFHQTPQAASPPPAIFVDWLSIAMVLVVSGIGSIIAVYALPYMKEHERHLGLEKSKRPRFFMLIFCFLGAMNGLVVSNNLMWVYFFWEITTLCSFLLIAHDGTPEAWTNAFRALWMNLIGGLAFALALLFLVREPGGAYISEILRHATTTGSRGILLLPVALLCLAGFTKSAQMPFQNWLLGAMIAPTPVSALLHSSTMVKAGVYLIIRFAPAYHGSALSEVVALAGAFTFVVGAMLAISQTNAKRLLAYSTISNLGLIIACAGLNTPLALEAAVMLLVFHAISKGLLFMATGVVEHNIWSREIEDMRGLVARMPLTTTLMIIGIFSMLMPPFGVLIAKLAAIEASANMPVVMVMLVIGSTLTLVFWTKWMGSLLTADPHAGDLRIEKLHQMYFGPLLVLTAATVVFSAALVAILRDFVGPAVNGYYRGVVVAASPPPVENVLAFPWAPVIIVLLLAIAVPLVFCRTCADDLRSAYMCGEQVRDTGEATFCTFADTRQALALRSLYFENLVGEQRHVVWTTAVATVLCVALIGVVWIP